MNHCDFKKMLVTTIIDFNVFIDHCKVLLPLNKSVKCTLDNSKYTGCNMWRSKDWSALLCQKTETETVFFYRGDRRSENLRVHTLIQGLLKEHVLLLRLAKYGAARTPCAPPIQQPQNEANQYNPIQLAIWMVLYLHIPV